MTQNHVNQDNFDDTYWFHDLTNHSVPSPIFQPPAILLVGHQLDGVFEASFGRKPLQQVRYVAFEPRVSLDVRPAVYQIWILLHRTVSKSLVHGGLEFWFATTVVFNNERELYSLVTDTHST